jgi:hypothetical protein
MSSVSSSIAPVRSTSGADARNRKSVSGEH